MALISPIAANYRINIKGVADLNVFLGIKMMQSQGKSSEWRSFFLAKYRDSLNLVSE